MNAFVPTPPLVERRLLHALAAPRAPGPRARAAALAAGATLLWATWPLLASLAHPAPPFLVLGAGAAVAWTLAGARAALGRSWRGFISVPARTLALVAVGLTANNALYLVAMPRIGPAEANAVAYLWPVMLVGLGALAHGTRLAAGRLAGLVVAFAGAATVIGPRFELGLDAVGLACAFGSGLAFALYALARSFGRETGDVIGPGLGVVALLSLGAHVAFEPAFAPSAVQWLAIAGIGLAPLGVSNALWDRASRTGELATVSGIAYATPLAALALLAATGAATVTWTTALGAVLIVAGACAASGVGRR